MLLNKSSFKIVYTNYYLVILFSYIPFHLLNTFACVIRHVFFIRSRRGHPVAEVYTVSSVLYSAQTTVSHKRDCGIRAAHTVATQLMRHIASFTSLIRHSPPW